LPPADGVSPIKAANRFEVEYSDLKEQTTMEWQRETASNLHRVLGDGRDEAKRWLQQHADEL
jgi:hypothetical protein